MAQTDGRFGFYNDERTAYAHGLGVRNGFLTTAFLALFVAAYHLVVLGQPDVWWITVALVVTASSLLLRQYVRYGGWDERLTASWKQIAYWPYVTLIAGIFLQSSYRFWVLDESLGLILWNGCLIAGPLMIVLTHVLHNTAYGHGWFWLLLGLPLIGLAVWLGSQTIWALQADGFPASFREATPLISLLIVVMAIALVFGLALWRSWQNRRMEEG